MTGDAVTLAEVIAAQLALYTLPANYSQPYGAGRGDTHDAVARRGGDHIARTILASDWLAAVRDEAAREAGAKALEDAADEVRGVAHGFGIPVAAWLKTRAFALRTTGAVSRCPVCSTVLRQYGGPTEWTCDTEGCLGNVAARREGNA